MDEYSYCVCLINISTIAEVTISPQVLHTFLYSELFG